MGSLCRTAKIVHAQTYFENRNTLQTSISPFIKSDDFKSNIRLDFKIENVEINHNYQLIVKFFQQSDFSTEIVKSINKIITFNKCFLGSYFFEKRQPLEVYLLKDGIHNGSLRVDLGSIVGSSKGMYRGIINNNIYIIISALGISDNISYVKCKFIANHTSSNDYFSKPENKISYVISSGNKKIYVSESVSINGIFKEVEIPSDLLINGFSVNFLDGYQDSIIYKEENIQHFCNLNNDIYLTFNSNNQRIYIYNKSFFKKNVSFIDYIKAGVIIKLTIGIDYTSSNKVQTDPKSLHYLGQNMNDYEQAIQACGMICAYYDYNQKFPVYGYGALLHGENSVNMCFNINFQQEPEIYTINNVLKEYRKSFSYLQLAGPTNFAPLVRKVVDNIRAENNPLRYHLLLILTDGIINDEQDTMDALVDGSFLPLSVIIIGVGDDHFTEMIELDGDDKPIKNRDGVIRMRDLVQFVPFNKYKNNPNTLAEQVLEEVPRQVIEYYTMNNLYPDNLNNPQSVLVNRMSQTYQKNNNSFNNSLNGYNSNINTNEYIALNIHNQGY
jgi:hypothetical protein